MVPAMAHISKSSALNERLEEGLTEAAQLVRNPDNTAKEDPSQDFLTTLEMNPELAILKLTLEPQELGAKFELQTAVLNQLKNPNFSNTVLSKWALEIVQFIASAKA